MRVVLDTDVLVAATRSRAGASRRLLVAALEGRLSMLVSVPLLLEYEAVLTRPEHLAAARLSGADVQDLLDAIAVVAEPVRLAFLWRPTLADADDDMVLEVAANGHAECLVTFNLRDFAAAARFGFDVLQPRQALARMEMRE